MQFVLPDGDEVTFGQLGVHSGDGWNYAGSDARQLSFGEGREPLEYIPAHAVEQRMQDLSNVIDRLDKTQLRAMMYAKSYSTTDWFNPMNRTLGAIRSIEGTH